MYYFSIFEYMLPVFIL